MSHDANHTSGLWRRRFTGVTISHLLADLYAVLPGALIAQLAARVGATYGAVSLLIGLNSLVMGAANLLFGLGSDRYPHLRKAFVLATAFVTVVAVSSTGMVTSYALLCPLMLLSAFACGAFHPPGFALGGEVIRERRQRYLSVLMAAGVAGGSLGAPLVGVLVARWGMIALTAFGVPGLVLLGVAIFLLRGNGRNGAAPDDQDAAPPDETESDTPAAALRADPPDQRAGVQLWLLFAGAALRAFSHMSVFVIISALMSKHWELGSTGSGLAVGALQMGAGLGGLLFAMITPAGREHRPALYCVPWCVLLLVPLALTSGWIWCLWLFLYGFLVNGPAALVVALAQHIAPRRSALVSGLMVGIAFASTGPIAAVVSPWLLDHIGQAHTILVLAVPLTLSFIAMNHLKVDAPPTDTTA